MANRIACEQIQDAWTDVSPNWSALVKNSYFQKVLLPLLNEADGIYQRNDNLEDFSRDCISRVTGGVEL